MRGWQTSEQKLRLVRPRGSGSSHFGAKESFFGIYGLLTVTNGYQGLPGGAIAGNRLKVAGWEMLATELWQKDLGQI